MYVYFFVTNNRLVVTLKALKLAAVDIPALFSDGRQMVLMTQAIHEYTAHTCLLTCSRMSTCMYKTVHIQELSSRKW